MLKDDQYPANVHFFELTEHKKARFCRHLAFSTYFINNRNYGSVSNLRLHVFQNLIVKFDIIISG
jgi:hypothetical protein